MNNLTIRVITSSSVNAYVMIGDTLTLCNVKFKSINTLNGEVTYIVTPKGSEKGISARVESGVTFLKRQRKILKVRP